MAQISPVKVGLVGAGVSATTFHAPFLKQSTVFNVTSVLRSSSSDPVPGLEKVGGSSRSPWPASFAEVCVLLSLHLALQQDCCSHASSTMQLLSQIECQDTSR